MGSLPEFQNLTEHRNGSRLEQGYASGAFLALIPQAEQSFYQMFRASDYDLLKGHGNTAPVCTSPSPSSGRI